MVPCAGRRRAGRERLQDGARVVVVGAGPAASFFAIRLLRRARRAGLRLETILLEKKREVGPRDPGELAVIREGCNYCAGGVSPRLADVLEAERLVPPPEIVQGRADMVVVHGDWKSVELAVPPGRRMFCVFRGSRPVGRPERYANFDAFLLQAAQREGARLRVGEAERVGRGPSGRPWVAYRPPDAGGELEVLEADFLAVAAGVNGWPGGDLAANPLVRSLGRVAPGFRPPRVRKSLICEIEGPPDVLRHLTGEIHFADYGSRDVRIEMSSMIPKGSWVTLTLLGPSVDAARGREHVALVERFLKLPHIRRLLPAGARLKLACLCSPNMTVRAARGAFGRRIAVIGDLAVSRLYKDGLYSAYLTGAALADCVLEAGVDRQSLRTAYWPAVGSLERDNRWGEWVYRLNRFVFPRPVLSRIFYQAVLTERKTISAGRRRLETLLWQVASGDGEYRRALAGMLHPSVLARIAVGGALVTLRNHLTERVFGLNWSNVGRYPTGVPKEEVERKRLEIGRRHGFTHAARRPDFERMYTIRIKAAPERVEEQLATFGEPDRAYFTPRFVHVRRVRGRPNQPGCVIRYDVAFPFLSFTLVLERAAKPRWWLYRVADGFARGGVLAFELAATAAGGCSLTIYVGFDFPRAGGFLRRLGWRLFRWTFPAYVHDVIWNHALCKLKQLAESEGPGVGGGEKGPAEQVALAAHKLDL